MTRNSVKHSHLVQLVMKGTPMATDKSGKKQPHLFQPGKSGNPKGRPKGSRNKASIAVDDLLEGQADKITQKALEMALNGDTVALRICMERICPPRKERPINIDMPLLKTAADTVSAMAHLIEQVCAGDITPEEAAKVGSLIEGQRRLFETEELERRIQLLENTAGQKS